MEIPSKSINVTPATTTPKLTNPHNPRPSATISPLKIVIPKIPMEETGGWVGPENENKNCTTNFIGKVKRLDTDLFPDQSAIKGNNPLQTIPNYQHLFRGFDIEVRYNLVSKKYEILIPGHHGSPDNADSTSITIIQSIAVYHGLSVTHLPSLLEAIGDSNLYNPVANWILAKPWDKKDRLKPFYNTLVHREDFPIELKEILLLRWLLSLVAAVLKPSGFHARGVLTLQGPQSIGKTSWIKALVNDRHWQKRLLNSITI